MRALDRARVIDLIARQCDPLHAVRSRCHRSMQPRQLPRAESSLASSGKQSRAVDEYEADEFLALVRFRGLAARQSIRVTRSAIRGWDTVVQGSAQSRALTFTLALIPVARCITMSLIPCLFRGLGTAARRPERRVLKDLEPRRTTRLGRLCPSSNSARFLRVLAPTRCRRRRDATIQLRIRCGRII